MAEHERIRASGYAAQPAPPCSSYVGASCSGNGSGSRRSGRRGPEREAPRERATARSARGCYSGAGSDRMSLPPPRELELPERDPVKAEVKDSLKQIIEAVVMRHFVEEQVSSRCHSLRARRMCSLHVRAAGDATGGAGRLPAAVLDARRGAPPRAATEAWQLQRSAAATVCSAVPGRVPAPGHAAPQPWRRRRRRPATSGRRGSTSRSTSVGMCGLSGLLFSRGCNLSLALALP